MINVSPSFFQIVVRSLSFCFAAVVMVVCCSSPAAARQPSSTKKAGPFADYRTPRGPFLFATPQQWEAARAKAETQDWAGRLKASIVAAADPWAAKTPEELTRLVPPAGAYYVYGLSKPTDPKTGEALRWSGWDAPFSVQNAEGTRYPNEDYPDDGTGWINPAGGEAHYFVAFANGVRIQRLETRVLPDLANAYGLTGEERYARAALTLLDAIATIYPTADSGPLDYPGLKPEVPGGGRLQRPWYQTARALVNYAWCYDALSGFKGMDAPSPSSRDRSIRENILEHLIGNGGAYCHEEALKDSNLHNGTLDYHRGALIAGALLGIPAWIEDAAHGANGLWTAVTNTLDPQGRYYETSSSYSGHTSDLMMTSALLLAGVNRGLPKPLPLPFDDGRFAAFCLGDIAKIEVAGRAPNYGDGGPDRAVIESAHWFDPIAWRNAVVFAQYAKDPAISGRAVRLLDGLRKGLDEERAERLEGYAGTSGLRLLFEGEKNVPSSRDDGSTAGTRHTLLSDAGLVLLRSQNGATAADERGVFLRLGPTRNHGQLDELGLQFYAFGREFSADPGYFAAHFRFGFTRTTVAHSTVVVDRGNQLESPSSGARLLSWLPGAGFASVEADSPESYAALKLKRYQRRMTQVDADGVYYLVDLFRVQGGSHYDYSFHAIHGGRIDMPDDSGLELINRRGGSVLSDSLNHTADLLPGGRLGAYPERPFFWAVPGQGYGFLGEPALYRSQKKVRLDWVAQDGTGHRLAWTHFPPPGAQITLAKVETPHPPSLYLEYALSRVSASPADTVRFLSLIRPQAGAEGREWTSREMSVSLAAPGEDAVGLEIIVKTQTGGSIAHHLFAATAEGREPVEFENGLRLQAREGFVSLDSDGVPRRIAVSEGSVAFGGLRLEAKSPDLAKILEISRHPLRFRIAGELSRWAAASGSAILVEGEGYVKPLAFQIVEVKPADEKSLWLTLDADSNLQSCFDADTKSGTVLHTTSQFPRVLPLVDLFDRESGLARSVEYRDSHYNGGFNGFWVASGDGMRPFARIAGMEASRSTVRLVDSIQLKNIAPGNKLAILAPVPGDRVRLLSWAQATRQANGKWVTTGPGLLIE
ncbi:MAG TPA: heparinase II/III family protein [Chthoniobacteraceae bacterium]|nr:heparinase II/III family protein [Chthoniobacteraceae bacterium]